MNTFLNGTYSDEEIQAIKDRIDSVLENAKVGNGGEVPLAIKNHIKEYAEQFEALLYIEKNSLEDRLRSLLFYLEQREDLNTKTSADYSRQIYQTRLLLGLCPDCGFPCGFDCCDCTIPKEKKKDEK